MSPPSEGVTPTTKQCVDRWFRSRGVPALADKHPLSKLLPVLIAPLLVVTAAQLATAPLLQLETWHVAVGPAVVTLVALPLLPTLRWMLDPGRDHERPSPRKWPLAIAVASAATVVVLLVTTGDDGEVVVEVAVNMGVLLLALVACVILLRPEVWARDEDERDVLQSSLFALAIAAVVVFALEGMPVEPLDAQALGMLPESAPAALPALPIVVLLCLLALLMSRNAPVGGAGFAWPGDRRDALFSVSPVLVLLLSVETTLLPTAHEPWFEALAPLGLLAILMLVPLRWPLEWSWYRTATRLLSRAGESTAALATVAPVVIGMYLLAYPALASFAGQEQLEVALLVNSLYLVVAGIGVGYGIDQMALWAWRKLGTNYRDILLGVLRGLPLLLVFTAFFLFTTELWQAAEGMPDWAFLALIGSVLGITFLFLLLLALADVKRHSVFEDWAAVRRAALRIEAGTRKVPHDDGRDDVDRLLREADLLDETRAEWRREPVSPLQLSPRRKLNVLGVVGVYQALIFIPLFCAAFGVFLGTGLLAVQNPLLDNWINGDQDPNEPRVPEDFFAGSFFSWPWTRVAFFLAAFSILYVAVDVVRSPDLRAQLFAGADEGVRQRLAVRKVYEERLPQWPRQQARADGATPRRACLRPRLRGKPALGRPSGAGARPRRADG
jgi:hypothetical protein